MVCNFMKDYTNAPRGTIQCKEYAEQLRSYEGLQFKGRSGYYTVTPTDIDGLVQLENENCFLVYELKHSGDVPQGQLMCLQALADRIQAGGSDCAVFVAVHNTPYPEVIMAKDAIVTQMYWRGKWYKKLKSRTLRELSNSYIQYIKNERNSEGKNE